MEPSSNHPNHPAALEEIGGTLVEPWWNPGGTLVEPWWNPGGTLPQSTPDHPAALVERGGTLQPWSDPRGTLPQPRPPRSPRRTWWKSGGTLVEPVEPYLKPPRQPRSPRRTWYGGTPWNPRGTLPQATPDGGTLVEPSWLRVAPNWAETQAFSCWGKIYTDFFWMSIHSWRVSNVKPTQKLRPHARGTELLPLLLEAQSFGLLRGPVSWTKHSAYVFRAVHKDPKERSNSCSSTRRNKA